MLTWTNEALLLLLGGLLPLGLAPWAADRADRSETAKAAMDGFVRISLGGIVLLHVWPHAYRLAGWWALLAGGGGLLVLSLLHRFFHALEESAYPKIVLLALFGVALHATLDGVALFAPILEGHLGSGTHAHSESATLLAAAVILHRFPAALAIWWLVVPLYGRLVAALILVTMAAATLVGFSVAGGVLDNLSTPAMAIVEALIAGMLLHLVVGHEQGHAVAARRALRKPVRLGGALGVAILLALSVVHPLDRSAIIVVIGGIGLVGLLAALNRRRPSEI